jgi:glycosyltransferase involved in cell wall biosynthesis
MPLGLVHGYGFSGAGSNLWTRAVLRALAQLGHEVHVVCQESHPERFDFVAAATAYDDAGTPDLLFERETAYPGRVAVHRPALAKLPTFVRPSRPSDYVVYIPDLADDDLEEYLARNARVLTHVAADHNVSGWVVNHVVMMAVAAGRAREAGSVPFGVLPHGSAIEYVVKKEERSRRLAEEALQAATRVYALNGEMEGRITDVFGHLPGIEAKVKRMPVGVDTTLFDVADRADRPRLVARIAEAIAEEPRGRTADHEAGLRRALTRADALPSLDDLLALFAEADYARSAPDAHAEAKLGGLDWQGAKTVLYVGRLIAAKGVPSVVMAFPDVVRQHPEARLLVAGAGGLREAMEALVWALAEGRRDLVEHLVGIGGALEAGGLDPTPFAAARGFLDGLNADGQLDAWLANVADYLTPEHVVFTGYLDHDALAPLYGLADVGVFPSVVREASPLVIPEAAASGAFPVGTDFGGMGDSLGVVGEGLPEEARPLLKARPDPEHTVADLAHHIAAALERPREHAEALRAIAEKRFDWRAIAARLADDLHALTPDA